MKPRIVIGGTEHRKATSFARKKLREYEASKSYRDQGVLWVAPTRGVVHTKVVMSWITLQWPMNQFRSPLIATEKMEVAAAYEYLFDAVQNRKLLRAALGEHGDSYFNAPFVLTTEEDNVLPPDAPVALLRAIFTCPDCGEEVGACGEEGKAAQKRAKEWRCKKGHKGYDAVSGLYFVKTDPPIPMAFGEDGQHFRPRSIAGAVRKGAVLECDGIAMGCALWRKGLFAKVPRPWFQTTQTMTQDLFFCKKAKKKGARFGVHCGVRVGHFDPKTGELF